MTGEREKLYFNSIKVQLKQSLQRKGIASI